MSLTKPSRIDPILEPTLNWVQIGINRVYHDLYWFESEFGPRVELTYTEIPVVITVSGFAG